jgi:D-alanyl-D-alanine carboxypeptidase/D-alanyl-D-alanine-endopeptidase (penicillin-binding protein 4)
MFPRRRTVSLAAAVACTVFSSTAAAPAPGASPTALWRQLAKTLTVPQVSRARTAAMAVDLTTGRVLFQHNQALALVPASNEKLAVTYAALVVLGPAYRVKTEILGAGTQTAATWHGDLVLKGYGDPTLTRGRLGTLVSRVRALGIRHVTGRVIADESYFDRRRTAPGWKPSFYLDECPPLSALIVDRARVGRVLTPTPALSATAAFSRALRAAGVSVAGQAALGVAPRTAIPLATAMSPPLWKILRFMDRESDNFTAEMLLKQLGALYGGRGSTSAGAGVVTRTLAADGIPLTGVRIVDGSGLSSLDRVTVQALLGILRSAWATPQLRSTFLGELAVAGINGTLRDRMTRAPTRGTVLAKTGTTSLSSALSGFVRHRIAFSIVNNGHPIASWWAEQAQDRFATRLARIK